MAASHETVDKIYEAVRKHVSDDQMRRIVDELLDVPGNKSFRDTIERLAALDARSRG